MGRFTVGIFVGCFLLAPLLADRPSNDDQVLDLVFPRENSLHRDTVFVFWLRFEPGIDPRAGFNSQIKVALIRNQPPVVEYASADRIISIFLGDAFGANPAAHPNDLARNISVRRKDLNSTSADVMKCRRSGGMVWRA